MAHIIGTPNDDILNGTVEDDLIEGLEGPDTLIGAGGNDTLDGGGGHDSMAGGPGDDVYVVVVVESPFHSPDPDLVVENASEGTDEVRFLGAFYELPANVEKLTLIGTSRGGSIGIGNELANVLTGNDDDNDLAGLGGADVMVGGGGIDTASYNFSPTSVTVSLLTNTGSGGDAEGDTLSGIEDLTGSQFGDMLIGDSGENQLRGAGGDDTLLGGAGDDSLDGGSDNDLLDGGDGTDNAQYANAGLHRFEVGVLAYNGQVVVGNAANGLDGLDRLASIETLTFADPITDTPLVSATNPDSPLEYIASYSDLMAAFGTDAGAGFDHFTRTGYAEGRTVQFDGFEYIASYGDLINAFGANVDAGATHYIGQGHAEGRQVTFNGLDYIASYGDLINAFGSVADAGANHFIVSGYSEGRSTTFNGLEYIASYDDLINWFSGHAQTRTATDVEDEGATHYIRWGHAEQRAPDLFDAPQYLANYADLQAAFGTDTEAATLHYITNGYFEGRTDQALS